MYKSAEMRSDSREEKPIPKSNSIYFILNEIKHNKSDFIPNGSWETRYKHIRSKSRLQVNEAKSNQKIKFKKKKRERDGKYRKEG